MKDACLPISRNILLHTCCAPCLIYPLEFLRENGFKVTGFFYNPNIHPVLEYNERKKAFIALNPDIEIIYPDYLPQEFFRAINLNEEAPGRCALCWRERLSKTARVAKEKDFGYFTTTLLVSPYQDQELLKRIGNDIAKEVGVEFYYADFRPGFRKAHNEARSKGVYTQKYCGCIYSDIERGKKKKNA
jgi:hypothetical protein